MLILEMGMWLLPFTLVLAPVRRTVRLVQELQRILLLIACTSSGGGRHGGGGLGEVWSRLDRLDSATVIIA